MVLDELLEACLRGTRGNHQSEGRTAQFLQQLMHTRDTTFTEGSSCGCSSGQG